MSETGFESLGLKPELMKVLEEIGYESPSPIQAKIIPHVMENKDVIGQAQTGTGKTGAFALPLLNNLDCESNHIQILVLTPTRELSIQVSEAFQKYAHHIKDFHVLPIYGGTAYGSQLRSLKRGVQVVVGTPGRLCDHLRKGTLKIDNLRTLVIDEADEMLRMGFIDEVEWILEQTPSERQVALFSATMPPRIRKIAQKYLKEPVEITIKSETKTASTINQRYWMVSGLHKLDALTRILEGEEIDAMIVFVRTRSMTTEIAEKLQARGFSVEPLNGDIQQRQREETVEKLRNGEIDIIVATDVAARGLDVQRISHVMNYDIPYDTESYIHRIGRTGRAGRTGDAILFVAPRERRLLASIEKTTGQKIELMKLPTREHINDQRIEKFRQSITDALASEEHMQFYIDLLEEYRQEFNIPVLEIAAALAKMVHSNEALLLDEAKEQENRKKSRKDSWDVDDDRGRKKDRKRFDDRDDRKDWKKKKKDRDWDKGKGKGKGFELPNDGFERWVLDVGKNHGAKPGNIVGAIANEAGLESRHIQKLNIRNEQSMVDLPADMPKEVQQILKKAKVSNRPLSIRKFKFREDS